MRKRKVFLVRAFVLSLFVHTQVPVCSAQVLAYAQNQALPDRAPTVKLVEALQKLKIHYGVDILYADHVVRNRVVQVKEINFNTSLEKNLNNILPPLGLQYSQQKGGSYVISTIKEEKRKTRTEAAIAPVTHFSQIKTDGKKEEVTIPVASAAITVKGKVLDEKGEVLPGVSVILQGTQRGTITEVDGSFTLEVPDQNAVLIFSFVGYEKKEFQVGNANNLSISLVPEFKGLGEVVVLGFGQTQKKIAQTGSVASISTKDLKQSPVANVTNALAGRLPGLTAIQTSGEPGNDRSQLLIRGRATFNGSDPLITIDGVQKDYSAIGLLDPNEIENIAILKDASATALYGVKGANGVIIITTRRGKEGKAVISATVQTAVQTTTRLPKFLDSYNYATLANEAFRNDNPTGSLPYSAEALEAYRTGSDPYKYPNVDWLKEMMQPAMQTQANLNISGGTKQVRYFVNVGYTDQGGIYKTESNSKYNPKAEFKRYNFRSNIDVDYNKDFSIALNLYGAIENKKDPRISVPDLFWTLLQIPPNAFPVKYPTGYYGSNGLFINPARFLNRSGIRESYNSSLSGMLSLTHKLNFITEGLSVKGNYSFDGYFRNSFNRVEEVQVAMYRGSGDYLDAANYTYLGVDSPLSAPSSSYTQNRDIWMDLSLNYNRTFGKHEVTGLLLGNRTQKVIGNEIPYVSQGLVGRITYNFSNRYFAEFNAGYNGTDNFSADKRYGFFPAVSAGWVLSEESFLKGNTVLTFLKARGSYGLTGNDQLPGRRWLFSSEYIRSGTSGYYYGDQLYGMEGVYEGPMANPAVTWEKAKKANAGIEASFFNELLSVNFDVFSEKRNDILITRGSVPALIGVTGSNLPPANMGKVENKGFEVELNHRHRVGEVSYFVRGNLSHAKNKLLYMDEENRQYSYQYQTGHPLGQFFGLTALGFFKDETDIKLSPTQLYGRVIPGDLKYKDLNGDGVIDQNDEGPIGKSNIPELFFGISGGINWRNFDCSFLLQGAGSSSRLVVGGVSWEFYEGGKVRDEHLNRWTPETAETATWPALHYGGNGNNHRVSSFYMDNNSYMRLKNLELGYTFKNIKVTKSASIGAVRIYTNGMNLYTWTKARPLLDPEYWNANSNGTAYPPQRLFNFGASVNF